VSPHHVQSWVSARHRIVSSMYRALSLCRGSAAFPSSPFIAPLLSRQTFRVLNAPAMASASSTFGESSSLGGTLASTKRARPVTNKRVTRRGCVSEGWRRRRGGMLQSLASGSVTYSRGMETWGKRNTIN
jgi:hypothetical protein